jgi:ribosome-binding protein aMBF1 (putative translation factor)
LTDELEFLTQSADGDRSGAEYRLQALVLEISDRVTTRLQKQGISQAELARRLGVSRPMITKLLTGDSNFQLRTLLRLAGCDPVPTPSNDFAGLSCGMYASARVSSR